MYNSPFTSLRPEDVPEEVIKGYPTGARALIARVANAMLPGGECRIGFTPRPFNPDGSSSHPAHSYAVVHESLETVGVAAFISAVDYLKTTNHTSITGVRVSDISPNALTYVTAHCTFDTRIPGSPRILRITHDGAAFSIESHPGILAAPTQEDTPTSQGTSASPCLTCNDRGTCSLPGDCNDDKTNPSRSKVHCRGGANTDSSLLNILLSPYATATTGRDSLESEPTPAVDLQDLRIWLIVLSEQIATLQCASDDTRDRVDYIQKDVNQIRVWKEHLETSAMDPVSCAPVAITQWRNALPRSHVNVWERWSDALDRSVLVQTLVREAEYLPINVNADSHEFQLPLYYRCSHLNALMQNERRPRSVAFSQRFPGWITLLDSPRVRISTAEAEKMTANYIALIDAAVAGVNECTRAWMPLSSRTDATTHCCPLYYDAGDLRSILTYWKDKSAITFGITDDFIGGFKVVPV